MTTNQELILSSIINSPEHQEKFVKHFISIEKARQKNISTELELEKLRLEKNIELATDAQYYAFLIAIFATICGSFIAYFGHDFTGAVIGTSGLGLAGMAKLSKIKDTYFRKTKDITPDPELNES